jgi:hypothetical protein
LLMAIKILRSEKSKDLNKNLCKVLFHFRKSGHACNTAHQL